MNNIDPLIHYAEILRIRQKAARRNSIFLGALLLIFIVVAILFFPDEFKPHLDIFIILTVFLNLLLAGMSQAWMEMNSKSMLELITVLQRRP
jgi:hypothetical protein